jgi:outer membrane protein
MRGIHYYVSIGFICFFAIGLAKGQNGDTTWNLQGCIHYALRKNLQIQNSLLNNETSRIEILQAKAARYPSASATVSQNFGWSRTFDQTTGYGDFQEDHGTSFGISSNVKLFNGFKIRNTIEQSELNYTRGQYDIQVVKDEISISILDAYLQVLFNEELVKNSQIQLEVTEEELFLAGEKRDLGSISQSDYLQIKAQVADEKHTLTNAQSKLTMSKLQLMQLMDLPMNSNNEFKLAGLDSSDANAIFPPIDSVYNMALRNRPEIRSAELQVESSIFEEMIARASYMPSLSLQGALGTGYASDQSVYNFAEQTGNKISPSFGLNLSVPIYQNRQGKSNVERAKVGISQAEINEQSTRNDLRKKVEQAYLDLESARKDCAASREQYQAASETFKIAQESFRLGLINSVDFFLEKNRLTSAESALLQSKYSLICSKKILEFYMGVPLTE